MTAKNPLGLKEERGFRVTKTGKKKAVDRAAAKPRANIKNEVRSYRIFQLHLLL